jgi:signal transduction histidine kinase/ActR/RegA family two-component response regulator
MAFQDAPIRRKLMTIILGTSVIVLLLACAGFLAYEFLTFRQSSIRQLSTLGEIIATNSTGAVAFDNRNDATEILSALRAESHVVAAGLYNKKGELLSRYPADAPASAFPAAPQADGYRYESGYLVGFAPVIQVQGSQRLGTLFLKSDLQAMTDRLKLYAGIVLLIVSGSVLVAYTLSRKLQQQISRPILSLAETAKAVSDRRDYSVRAGKFGDDELGLLTDAFNQMLERIEEQNLALQRAYDDLRQTQQTIMQQERLRALGQMASGIAHDINNAISPASLYVESLLEKEPNLTERGRQYLTTTQRALDDIAQTVSRLREFYRPRESQLELVPVNLNQLVTEVIDLARVRWSDMAQQRGVSIDVQTHLTEPLPLILGTESEIREALLNLIFNAIDAMPTGGAITVRTWIENPPAPNASVRPDSRVGVEVTDSGVGMDDETKRRCLEPFFTTKGERGTGLGLAMVYGTVRRHNAAIEIDSTPGHGTAMRLRFPWPEISPDDYPSLPSSTPFPARLRLLIVDDDRVLLESLRETLTHDGHEVIAAEGGQAGIDVFTEEHHQQRSFAAVITDLGMPVVDGRRVAAAIKNLSPLTPVLMLTGWGQRMAEVGEVPPNVDVLLHKPPKLRELREALAALPDFNPSP